MSGRETLRHNEEEPAVNVATIILAANALSRECPQLPILRADSSCETLARWLQACDPNGAHTDSAAIAEGFEPYTVESAWAAIVSMLE